MKQLEFQFFWPLTEQIPLDLDYTPSYEHEARKRADTTVAVGNFIYPNGSFTVATGNISSSFVIDVDQTPLTLRSSKKPNIFRRYLYKILGVRWQSKC